MVKEQLGNVVAKKSLSIFFQVEVVYSSEVTPPFMTGWLMNKFFPGREQLKWKMAALFESGILSALEEKEYREFAERMKTREKKIFNDKETIRALSLEDIQGTIIILLAGYSISLLVFMIETLFFKAVQK